MRITSNSPARLTALMGAFALASLTRAQLAPASNASAADEPVKLEVFTVTGSNLRRIETENSLPVSTINREALDARDAQTPIDLLASLPQVVSVPLNEASTLGAGARGDNSSVSLRGLSTGNTLVLLNGRRLAPHPISQAESSVPSLSVNVAQLPNRGVDRLELLRDGASSIYGSDAVAGVVNLIMRNDYRGTEVTGRYGVADEGSGNEWRGTVLFGRDLAGGKARVVTTFDVYHREAIFLRDRSFSADADLTKRAPAPWNDTANSTQFFNRSALTAYGSFTAGTLAANGTFTGARPTGAPATLASTTGAVFFVPNGSGGAAFKTTTPLRTGVERDYYYNLNDEQVIQPKSTRYSWYGGGEFDLTPTLTAFANLNYYRAISTTYRDTDGYSSTADARIIVPTTNPWNPFGTRFFSPTGAPNSDGTPRLTGTPSQVQLLSKRFMGFGSKHGDVDSQVYRGVFGVRGKLLQSWTWEAAALHSAAHTSDIEHPTTRESFIIDAINQTDPARAFNPFGYNFAVQNGTIAITTPYANPASIVAPLQQSFRRDGNTTIGSFDFRATGEAVSLWGGNKISAAVGGEWRRESYDDTRPPFAGLNPPGSGLDPTDNDFLALSPNSDTHALRSVWAGYVEAVVPLVGRQLQLPLVQSFEVNASARIERYSDFGTARKPKVGATWRLDRWLLARASYNEGFRAPNLAQLFTGELIRSTASTDTYRSPVTGLPTDASTLRQVRRGGNLSLRPEQARGKSAGVVVEVPWVKGLSFSVDYWEINQLGLIDQNTPIPDDLDALNAATQAALAKGTAINQIDLGSGTANYLGSPNVKRLAVTQQDRDLFAAYNATRAPGNQRAVVGGIQYTSETYFNKTRQFVNGFDYGLTYRLPRTAFGRFAVSTEWSRYNSFYQNPVVGAPRDVRLWENGAAKWRGNANLTWRGAAWGAGVGAYYIGSYQDTGATTSATTYANLGRPGYISEVFDTGLVRYRYIVHDSLSYNAYATYNYRGRADSWLANTSVRFGVVNIFNLEPPLTSNARGYDPTVYGTLARGRTYSLEISKKL